MRFVEALAELEARQPESMPEPSLDRIRAITELLDDPQLTYPTIHVTGTNGKTTTARLIAHLACAHGLAAGLTTSPHLLSVTERFQLCGEPISEDEFAREYEHLLPYVRAVDEGSELRMTYFEVLTALAFLWFADKPVSLAVVEVGMGGTWDATNLVAGDVAVLCPISLDHRELGDTVAQVATEKAGIIKAGKVAVVREQVPEAMAVVRARADEVGATLLVEGEDFALTARQRGVGGQVIGVRTPRATHEDLVLAVHGEHAARNTAAAITALEALLDRPLAPDATREAVASFSTPGRLEVVERRPLLILDGAHNPAAAEALVDALRETFTWDRLHLVVAGFTSHDLERVIGILSPIADRAYAAANASSRSRPVDEIAAFLIANHVPTERFGSVAEALASARIDAAQEDLILVTGSLYTVADARRALGGS
jgi:dihydrofolate synthase/folylpolyglutamate synthase